MASQQQQQNQEHNHPQQDHIQQDQTQEDESQSSQPPPLAIDAVQDRLEAVNRRLLRRSFLKTLDQAQLPSQAASDTSISPPFPPAVLGRLARSPLRAAVDALSLDDLPDDNDDGHLLDEHTIASVLTADSPIDHRAPLADAGRFERYQIDFLNAWRHFGKMTSDRERERTAGGGGGGGGGGGYTTFDHEHADLILAVDFNFYGTRMVTASSDHRLKVWDKKDETWTLTDGWRAHDAEIVDVKWNGPFLGAIIGSVAEDGMFKIWQEDLTATPRSGRRFKRISWQQSETKVPFMSMDWKNIMTETYVALVTRDGHLSVYEPVDHESLAHWQPIHQKYVGGAVPSRAEETSFRVCFHKEQVPCWPMVQAGLDRKSLSLAVAAMTSVKIFRTDKARAFYLAAEIPAVRGLLRDVAWANGSMRGFDVLATAGKDGAVRIYELHVAQGQPQASDIGVDGTSPVEAPLAQGSRAGGNASSGIGAGLAGTSAVADKSADESKDLARIRNVVKKVAEVSPHRGAVWRVAFSQLGDMLVSTGDDGVVRTWKKSIAGQWLEYSEIDIEQPET